ncbi:Uncharacterised protein [Weeksella virosa]|uniref:Uncharacterized protein n=1 Tax=Weeksella virosa (strain ATCC 43766 / DSM 16922 / JCM 21250 / CCUG 30538 / CDC 9751 / IAM 14551 / NBRC 16016 / NCTC 11634 / CL345/78) TaxID=865938 RepID=F0P0R2_WEEVC|nr:hypothetical protein Weevi_0762 [Weeksella virosa DSM 16922]SUP53770.1 Uncharacterised protein [Weeksella virosa]VEH62781.1 Uncharacterised protein [Weeksella virosa]
MYIFSYYASRGNCFFLAYFDIRKVSRFIDLVGLKMKVSAFALTFLFLDLCISHNF